MSVSETLYCGSSLLLGGHATSYVNKEVELEKLCWVDFVLFFSFSPSRRAFFSQATKVLTPFVSRKRVPTVSKSACTFFGRRKLRKSAFIYAWIVLPWNHGQVSSASVPRTKSRTLKSRHPAPVLAGTQIAVRTAANVVHCWGLRNTSVSTRRRDHERSLGDFLRVARTRRQCCTHQTDQRIHWSAFETRRSSQRGNYRTVLRVVDGRIPAETGVMCV